MYGSLEGKVYTFEYVAGSRQAFGHTTTSSLTDRSVASYVHSVNHLVTVKILY